MKKKVLAVSVLTLAFGAAGVTSSPLVSAHNRGKVELPNGGCAQTGSLKSVTLPDQSRTPNSNVINGELRLDLRTETSPQDEIGTAQPRRAKERGLHLRSQGGARSGILVT